MSGGNNWSSDLGLLHSSAGHSLAEVVNTGSTPDSSGHGGSGELLGHKLLLNSGGSELDWSCSWQVPVDNSEGLRGQLRLDVNVGLGLDFLVNVGLSFNLHVLVGNNLGGGGGRGSKTN